MRHLGPTIDKEAGELKAPEPTNPLLRREMGKSGHPMIPNLVELSPEEQRRFQQGVGGIYLANLINMTMNIVNDIAQGEFLDAETWADAIWNNYPDIIPFLDDKPPSKILKARERDFVNYRWSEYADIDDAVMMSVNRRYYVTDDKLEELVATRERAIQREYLFEFLQRVHFGMRELGWLLSEEHRVGLGETSGGDEEPAELGEIPEEEGETTDQEDTVSLENET